MSDKWDATASGTNPLDEPDLVTWSNEEAMAWKGHGHNRAAMEEWARLLGWEELPRDVDEVRIVKVPDRSGEFSMLWRQSESPRATAYTIVWNRPRWRGHPAGTTSQVMDPGEPTP